MYKKERETRTKTLSCLTEYEIGKTKLELDKVWIGKIDKQFWKHMGKNKHIVDDKNEHYTNTNKIKK